MIELVILNYLKDHLEVPVYMEHEHDMPNRFVTFERTSGDKTNHLNKCLVAFQSYAPSLYEASLLNEQLKQTVEGMITLNEIAGVHLVSDYNFTDTQTKKYRYQAVFDFRY